MSTLLDARFCTLAVQAVWFSDISADKHEGIITAPNKVILAIFVL